MTGDAYGERSAVGHIRDYGRVLESKAARLTDCRNARKTGGKKKGKERKVKKVKNETRLVNH